MKGVKKGLTFGAVVLAVIFLMTLMTALWGLIIMLGFGIAWHEFGVGKPLGFWPSAGIGLVLEAVVGLFKSGSKKD